MDLEPKLVSLWWTSTYASEEEDEMILGTSKSCCKFSFNDQFRTVGCVMNRQGKTCDAVEERMQSANEVFGKDIKMCKSKDVLWRENVSVWLVDHVYAVFLPGWEQMGPAFSERKKLRTVYGPEWGVR